jgi:hypothetical protein
MNYKEAIEKVEKSKHLIGAPLGDYTIAHLIISTLDKLNEVLTEYYSNGFDNENSLIKFGIINSEDLNIYLFPPRYIGAGFFSRLDNYLPPMPNSE